MLHLGDYDLIALTNKLVAIGVSYKVDGLSRVAREDNLSWVRCAKVTSDNTPCLLIEVSADIAQMVDAPVNVAIYLAINIII